MAWPYSLSFTDAFTRADAATLGANYSRWDAANADLGIDSNRARGQVSGGGNFNGAKTVATYGPDCACLVQAPGTEPSQAIYMFLRQTGATTFYWLEITGANTWKLYKRVSGTDTQLGATATQTISDTHWVGMEAVSTTIKCHHSADGSSWSQINSQTDSAISGAGNLGFMSQGNIWIFDNFAAGTIAAAASGGSRLSTLLAGAPVTFMRRWWQRERSGLIVPRPGIAVA